MEPEDFNWKYFCWRLSDEVENSFVYLDRDMKFINKNKVFESWECFENWIAKVELNDEEFFVDENLNKITDKKIIKELKNKEKKEQEEERKEEEKKEKEKRTINVNNLSIELKPHSWQAFVFEFNKNWQDDYYLLTDLWLYTIKEEKFKKLITKEKKVSSFKITWNEELEIFIVD